MPEKQRWHVAYEARQLGSIGKFGMLETFIEATSKEDAQQQFREQFQDMYELRFPVYCKVVPA